MLIKYSGAGNRLLADLSFSPTCRTHEITDPAVVQYMLTTPGERFSIDPADPLLTLVGADAAGALALEGILSPDALAQADVETILRTTGCTRKQVDGWLVQTGRPEEEAEPTDEATNSGGDYSAADEPAELPAVATQPTTRRKRGG